MLQNLTNMYSLSKTLRFELKPIGNTQRMLEESHVFQLDKLRKDKYEKTKPYFDKLHRKFVVDSLQGKVLYGLERYLLAYKNWKKDKKDKIGLKELQNCEKELRQEIVSLFDQKALEIANNYIDVGFKAKNHDILFEENVFGFLKVLFDNDQTSYLVDETTGELTSIFDDWKGFTGYFGKFHETRKNFYKVDGTASAIATRMIDENLRSFCDNLEVFEKIILKVDGCSIVENNFNVKLGEVFSLEFYNNCLLQDGIDFYNAVIGGTVKENGEKVVGLNELINLYRQKNKGEKIPYFNLLDKQILSEKDKSFIVGEIKDNNDLYNKLKEFVDDTSLKFDIINRLFTNFAEQNYLYDLSKVYFSKESLNTIFYKWANEPKLIQERLFDVMKAEKIAKYDKVDDSFTFPEFVSWNYIFEALNIDFEGVFWKDKFYKSSENQAGLFEMKGNLFQQFLLIYKSEFVSLLEGYLLAKEKIVELLKKDDFYSVENYKTLIKEFADSALYFYQFAKYFAVEKKRSWNKNYEIDDLFYKDLENGYLIFYTNAYETIIKKYNLLRNYLTKKEWVDVDKWKLNFEIPTLANGWDKNKETSNNSIILEKDGHYFLAVMKKGDGNIFEEKKLKVVKSGGYRKMVYKYFPDPAKMFPKVCFSRKGLVDFKPSEDIYRIYKNEEFKKGNNFSLESMWKLIDFYKSALGIYDGWKCYNFLNLKPTKEYKENIGEFYSDVSIDGYRIDFINVDDDYINNLNINGKLFLFELRNQDYAENKKINGLKNLHTLYFENLFSKENENKNFVLKLNGQAELFFRPAAIKEKFVKRKFTREIVEKKRYTQDKIFFHVPITLNRVSGDIFRFNSLVNNLFAKDSSINVIGVDRGEKHLAYYSVVDGNGKQLDSGSLNSINDVDYFAKLTEKANVREQSRKDWMNVEGIKDLKKGYISQVVRKLADLIIKYNAIIVLEDLNMRFKQIRGGIEKSIYQQLEKALIDKLSYLVMKGEKNPNQAGHILKAYQLTAPFTSFKDMGKQTGIIFYTQAAYTSKIDPLTGWRPNLYLKYANAEAAKKIIAKFERITFNKENNYFEFSYDLKKFVDKKSYPKKTEWTVCSCVERYRWNKSLNQNKGAYEHYLNLTEEFKKLFSDVGIELGGDLKRQIDQIDAASNVKFFKDFIFFFTLICQIRNTDPNTENINKQDFILSPVQPFFDSRASGDFGTGLPKNGDENGAYNIARKGIVILNKIRKYADKNGNCDGLKWSDLFISDVDWDNYVSEVN